MSANIFSRKGQLKTKLLRGNSSEPSGAELVNGDEGGAEIIASNGVWQQEMQQEQNHFSDSALSNGIKQQEDVKLELSSTYKPGSSLNHLSRSTFDDGSDEELEEEEEEEEDEYDGEDGGGTRSAEVLVGFNLNEDEDFKTLPRPHNPAKDSVVCRRDKRRSKWEEAALYVQEGEDDAKFYQHPNSYWSKRAYGALHYPAYHILHLIVAVLLLLLAMAEFPAVGGNELNSESKKILLSIHGVLELLFLLFLTFDIALKWVWLGTRHFVIHRRTVLITCVLAVMSVETLTVMIRQENHIRVTRLLRPLFLIDTYYMVGVRRVLRQIFLSLKDIVHVLFLMMFFILLFSLFGYLIFSVADPIYFSTFSQSFVSLFITMTTANNPDVMMDSYSEYPATPIFFIAYIIVTLYFASNVLLAVVYSSFSRADKKKFRKLLCHKIDALNRAFHILGCEPSCEIIQVKFHDFLRFMAFYKPRIPEWQVMCIFKALHRRPQDQYHGLDLEEFQRFYEVIDFKWEQVNDKGKRVRWFSKFSPRMKKPIQKLHSLVNNKLYKFCLGLVVLVNLVFLVAYTTSIQDSEGRFEKLQKVLPVSFVFLSIYIVDIFLNMVGFGPTYFKKFWYIADLFVIILSLICLCLEPTYHHLAIVRPLKLLRLVRMKRQYRDIMNTMISLVPRLLSVFFLILIIYYAFAIVGLEFFAHKVSPGCCNESWYNVELYYSANPETTNITHSVNVYYLNNFNNILRSYVTLFILMVVNNWYIIMEGFASVGHYPWLARWYFMSFYIITLVVLQVVISFIVEAFVFKIQATQKRRECTRHPNADCNCKRDKKKKQYITLVEEDIAKLKYEVSYLREQQNKQKLTLNRVIKLFRAVDIMNFQESVKFVGHRDHTKEDVHILMYKDEVKNWIKRYKRLSSLKKPEKKATLKESFREMMGKVAMNTMEFLLD